MHRLAVAPLLLGVVVLTSHADDEPAPRRSSIYDDAPAPTGSPAFEALKKELNAAQAKHKRELTAAQKGVNDAKSEDKKQEAQRKFEDVKNDLPGPKYAERFLDLARQHPEDPKAFTAALTAFNAGVAPATKDNTRGQALVYLRANFAAKPQIQQVVRMFEASKAPAGEALLRDVLAKNPNHRIQGHACKALLAVSTRPAEKAALGKMLKGKYADLFPDLSVGKPVPEIVAKNVAGKEVKVSNLRGKVVVLDVWATWCPHCRAMIPQERQMVQRLKTKPFALVSISMDDKKETLVKFLAKDELPWPQWWVGASSDLAEDWNIEYFPTVYVIDARGVIRNTGVTGDDLDAAVDGLLRKMEKKR